MPFTIAIIGGAGYVGLTTGACLARESNKVICLDIDSSKVDLLNKGNIPIYEEGMEFLVTSGLKRGTLRFTTSYKDAVEPADIIFLALPTPTVNGEADLSFIAKAIPELAKWMNCYKVIVTKSTVPPGSGKMIEKMLKEELVRLGKKIEFGYVSNPEFLRQGSAVQDFIKPDRIVIGSDDTRALKIMDELYYTFKVRGVPIHLMNTLESETVKYASNAFLATKISFVNGVANLCDALELDAYKVLEAWADDKRIGRANMHPCPGYGGSCFPKDTEALVSFGKRTGAAQPVVEAVIKANVEQRKILPKKVEAYFLEKGTSLKGKVFGLLGLSFKAETDDMRESSSIDAAEYLISRGASIQAYDPAANTKAKAIFGDKVKVLDSMEEAVCGTDAILILTDWNEFKQADPAKLVANCRNKVIFDGRNLFIRNPEKAEEMREAGIEYIGIGTRQKPR